jgi:hypothetical protein
VPTTNTLFTLITLSLGEYCSSFPIGFLPGFLIGVAGMLAEVALLDELLLFAIFFPYFLEINVL